MTQEESQRFWRIYGREHFDNPPMDPTFDDLYEAIKTRLQDELFASGFGRLIERRTDKVESK